MIAIDYPSDFLINHDLSFDRAIRCHSNVDFAVSFQGDILETSTNAEAILQKIFLLMATKPGELPGDPNVGWILHKYFYKKATPNVFAMLEREMAYQFNTMIPELGVQSIKCEGQGNDYGRVDGIQITMISRDYGKIVITADKSRLDGINLDRIPTEAFH